MTARDTLWWLPGVGAGGLGGRGLEAGGEGYGGDRRRHGDGLREEDSTWGGEHTAQCTDDVL